MLGEEVEMEVKPSPRLLTSNGNAKGTQLDKAKDNFRTPGNGSQRYNKRRDPAQQKPESTSSARKPQPQKFKGLDKRPRGRNAQWNGRRDEVTQVQRVEYGSALPNGPKKVNLNHLINFTFLPRDSYGDGTGSGGSLSGRNRWNRRRPRYNKEQFLQANCQFVVKADHDYTVHAADADILVEWELIEQVRIFSHEEPSCPICLYPPTAAKITRCGHVYCWSCILHYLSLGDRSWRKCPICYESIIGKDLKSVVTVATHSYCVGEQVTMRLMKREKGSVVAVPVSHNLHKMNDPFKMGDAVTKESFVKLLTTTQSQILAEIIIPEKEILQVQLATCEEDFERTFVEAAIKLHQEREDALISQTVVPTVIDHVETANPVEQDVKHLNLTTESKNCFAYASAFSDEEDVEGKKSPSLNPQMDASLGLENQQTTVQKLPETQATEKDGKFKDSDSKDDELKEGDVKVDKQKEGDTKEDKLRDGDSKDGMKAEVERNRRRRQSSENEHTYYFYQAADSQHMYIHSLNVRCLVNEYGSLAKCPETITGEVIEIDHITMTEELRKRFRYLKHLPLTCEFCVCELRLKPPIISKETIKAFSDDFHKKKRARDKKVREEKKRAQKIELEEGRKQGLYPSPSMSMRSHTHFPEFSTPQPSIDEESCVRSVSPTSSVESGSIVHDESAVYERGHGDSAVVSSVDVASSASDVSMSTPSFAQMLRTSPVKTEAWPNLSSRNSKPTVVSAALSWPKSHGAGVLDGSDEENEDYVPVPTYKDSFSNAIQVALDKAAVRGQGSLVDPLSSSDSPKGKKGKKGKKKQKQLLFSTAGQRFK
ncbi:RING finger protein 10-like isoform X2 [Anneissia japonica]|uniref:RING finger protein 10-like isoform X2 n=1 Tax=Anneissia japonica TaxID=1529436 RepID=UPI0014257E49|nr:RING finger protein 10-like isoform X2 [Anneissia japonica]